MAHGRIAMAKLWDMLNKKKIDMKDKPQCNQQMFRAFKNVIFRRFKRTLDKDKVLSYVKTYMSVYSLNNDQINEINGIINNLK